MEGWVGALRRITANLCRENNFQSRQNLKICVEKRAGASAKTAPDPSSQTPVRSDTLLGSMEPPGGVPGASRGAPGGLPGGSRRVSGVLGGVLGGPGRTLGPSWGVPGGPRGVLGGSREVLGGSWEGFRGILGCFWSPRTPRRPILDRFGADLGSKLDPGPLEHSGFP